MEDIPRNLKHFLSNLKDKNDIYYYLFQLMLQCQVKNVLALRVKTTDILQIIRTSGNSDQLLNNSELDVTRILFSMSFTLI